MTAGSAFATRATELRWSPSDERFGRRTFRNLTEAIVWRDDARVETLATAMYAGLRRGGLQGLRIEDIDLRRAVINVRHTWDPVAGPLDPKSRSGVRIVPIPARLNAILAEHLLGLDWSSGLAFGRSQERPFSPKTVHTRARCAWADLDPLTLHE